jgi:hypothetical protein
LDAYSDATIKIVGLSPAEVASPSSLIPRWPNPGAMVNFEISSKLPLPPTLPPTRAFLKYLNDWFYVDLSQQSHLGSGGWLKRAGALISDYRRNPDTEENLRISGRRQVAQAAVLVLALASELEVYLKFGLRERAQYVWGIMTPYVVIAKELYDKRYASLLGAAP